MNDTKKNETEPETATIPATGKPGEKARHPRRKAVIAGVAAVVVVALCAGGFAAWRVHENRLDEQARTDCAKAARTLKTSRTAWEKLLRDTKAGAGKVQASQVKDAKTVDALRKALAAKTPTGSASCTAGDRGRVQSATVAIRRAAQAYDKDSAALRKAAKAVEASKLDKTVADATKLLADTKGKVKDDSTRQSLDKAIKARDADAIAKAVKSVNDSKAAKDKADAEAKARKEAEEAAAAAAKAAQQQSAASSSSGYSSGNSYGSNSGYSGSYGYNSGSYGSGYSNSNRSYSTPSSNGSTSSKPSTSTPSQSTGSSNSGSSSSGSNIHYDWEDKVTINPNCDGKHFCPIG